MWTYQLASTSGSAEHDGTEASIKQADQQEQMCWYFCKLQWNYSYTSGWEKVNQFNLWH